MEFDHALEKRRFGSRDVFDRLARNRLRPKADEVTRMARTQGDADLAVRFEAADARSMSRARVNDNEGPLFGINLDALRRHDPDQSIIGRARQRTAVHYEFIREVEDVRCQALFLLAVLVPPLPQDVPEENRALGEIDRVLHGVGPDVAAEGRPDPGARSGDVGAACGIADVEILSDI